jgi:hypothetical protein
MFSIKTTKNEIREISGFIGDVTLSVTCVLIFKFLVGKLCLGL